MCSTAAWTAVPSRDVRVSAARQGPEENTRGAAPQSQARCSMQLQWTACGRVLRGPWIHKRRSPNRSINFVDDRAWAGLGWPSDELGTDTVAAACNLSPAYNSASCCLKQQQIFLPHQFRWNSLHPKTEALSTRPSPFDDHDNSLPTTCPPPHRQPHPHPHPHPQRPWRSPAAPPPRCLCLCRRRQCRPSHFRSPAASPVTCLARVRTSRNSHGRSPTGICILIGSKLPSWSSFLWLPFTLHTTRP